MTSTVILKTENPGYHKPKKLNFEKIETTDNPKKLSNPEDTESQCKTLKILVVDDEDIIHKTLKRILEGEGYLIDSAYSGKEGLQRIKSGYDLIICDICMPDMGGVDVIKEIRKEGNDIEVLMFTGYSTLDAIDQSLKHGAYECITKSFTDISVLKNKIKEALERSRKKSRDE